MLNVQALKEFCGGVAEVVSQWEATSEPEPEEDTFPKPYCDQLHNETGLPTGDDFHHAVFRMIAAGDGMVSAFFLSCSLRSALDGCFFFFRFLFCSGGGVYFDHAFIIPSLGVLYATQWALISHSPAV